MELDVRLSREADEAWGFRLIGGIDFGMPLTVVKVIPDSSAERSGLRNGDVVSRIDDQDACDLSHDEARDVVAGASSILTLGVTRGLYDPVLDDQEPIYEPLEPEDFDQPSQPTEEEIKEIERKSSLLASAIDKTIKSIEEYKEQAGIDSTNSSKTSTETSDTEETNSDNTQIIYNGFAKVIQTKVYDTEEMAFETDVAVNRQVISNTERVNKMKDLSPTTFTVKKPLSAKNTKAKEAVTNGDGIVNGVMEDIDVPGYRSVQFNPEEIVINRQRVQIVIDTNQQRSSSRNVYVENGEILGTDRGIVDGLEEAIVDAEVAKELGKPGITEDKIAELMSGESEMLREAHVMGLSRVLKSHMHRPTDDSSVDFKKIKPIIESLKDSEVLKALNDELTKTKEEKKKEQEKKWTTFLQKPERPAMKGKFGYYKHLVEEQEVESPYKVKIVKQPKPKVAPDYKPPETENFETGPLPWEERAANEPPAPPVAPEDPILVPEETPEFFEAVDPLPESEVPDLEETGIPLPPEKTEEPEEEEAVTEEQIEEEQEPEEVTVEEEAEEVEEMEENKLAEQLITTVQSMVDPTAPLEQQLAAMRAQLAALAQLPAAIQNTLDAVARQITTMTAQESTQSVTEARTEVVEETITEKVEVTEMKETIEHETVEKQVEMEEKAQVEEVQQEEVVEEVKPTQEELAKLKREEEEMLEEQKRIEKQKKEIIEQQRLDSEARQLKQRPTPRVGKPQPMFGPLVPQERPLVLPGGRKWRKPKDAYNEAFIAETLSAQAEIIQGKALGINFMKYEKPPVSLDHLQNSDTYKLIHDMEQAPVRRVDMLTPVIAECDYREKCRSMTPCIN